MIVPTYPVVPRIYFYGLEIGHGIVLGFDFRPLDRPCHLRKQPLKIGGYVDTQSLRIRVSTLSLRIRVST